MKKRKDFAFLKAFPKIFAKNATIVSAELKYAFVEWTMNDWTNTAGECYVPSA